MSHNSVFPFSFSGEVDKYEQQSNLPHLPQSVLTL
jgi:hypothetical protein